LTPVSAPQPPLPPASSSSTGSLPLAQEAPSSSATPSTLSTLSSSPTAPSADVKPTPADGAVGKGAVPTKRVEQTTLIISRPPATLSQSSDSGLAAWLLPYLTSIVRKGYASNHDVLVKYNLTELVPQDLARNVHDAWLQARVIITKLDPATRLAFNATWEEILATLAEHHHGGARQGQPLPNLVVAQMCDWLKRVEVANAEALAEDKRRRHNVCHDIMRVVGLPHGVAAARLRLAGDDCLGMASWERLQAGPFAPLYQIGMLITQHGALDTLLSLSLTHICVLYLLYLF
jgi:hypothetical protein